MCSFSSDDSKPIDGDSKKDDLPSSSGIKIDPENAADEFTSLLKENKSLREGIFKNLVNFLHELFNRTDFFSVNEQMQIVIEKLVSGSSNADQILKTLKVFRESCVSKDFKSYNECIAKVKNLVIENENSALWELIDNGNYLFLF